MGRIVRIKAKDIDPRLTKEEKQQLRRAAKMPIVFDEDCPELTEEELKQFKRLYKTDRRKKLVSLRISDKSLKKAKSLGKGYTSFLSRLIDCAINDENIVKKCL